MRWHRILAIVLVCLAATGWLAWAKKAAVARLLVTGKAITPSGRHVEVGSFPARMTLSPDGRWIAVASVGFRQFLTVLDAASGRVVSRQAFDRHAPDGELDSINAGLAFAPDRRDPAVLYVARGPQDLVGVFEVDGVGNLQDTGRTLADPSGRPGRENANVLAGMAVSADGRYLYVAHNGTASLGVLDAASGRVLGRVGVAGFPFAVAALPGKVYVSSERDGVVCVVDVRRPAAPRLLRRIAAGDHPMALLLDGAGRRLFVANAGSDTVSVVDTGADHVVETVLLRPDAARSLPGATPTGLALSPDGRRLYVTLGDMNAVAVVSLQGGRPALQGYLPVGWYPTDVRAVGDHLLVSSAKGIAARHPNQGKAGPGGSWGQYVQNIIEGTVSCIAAPGDLKASTAQVLANNRLQRIGAAPLSHRPPIEHVIYVIKENRTYDQVLGDLPAGNGDARLTLFGRKITPNQHALAERFVLLDNFYCCAEVSADGWNWSLSGMASEYAERNVPLYYSGRTRYYDFEGTNLGKAVDLLGQPDVARAPGGYLWDLCARRGVSYRTYGVFTAAVGDGDARGVPDNAVLRRALRGHSDPDYRRFDMTYPDSDAFQRLGIRPPHHLATYGARHAPGRVAEWRADFERLEARGDLPRLSILRLPRDHTAGTRAGFSAPRAMAADNDLAVGQIVETVSRSRFWKRTAIVIVEDDAQSGHDHVDAHRSTCYVVSPYVRRGFVDHRFYNTDSVLHTIEALLGLPSMCQYDATAPALDVFADGPDNAAAYVPIVPAKAVLAEVNQGSAYRAGDSARLDFSAEDRVPDAVLNDILWHAVKGRDVEAPALRHGYQAVGEGD